MAEENRRLLSRRRLLQGAGAAAVGGVLLRRMTDSPGGDGGSTTQAGAALGRTSQGGGAGTPTAHGAPLRGIDQTSEDRQREGRFGLMFKRLDAFRPSDALLSGLAAAMIDRTTGAATHLDNPDIPAGYTFLGQFLDHDITMDRTPLEQQQRDPKALTQYRTPRYDLDSVYGGGPGVSPELYDPQNRAKLRLGGGNGMPEDLPRTPEGKAIIGDPRNDENLLVAQIHAAFLKFHNRLVDHLGGGDVFAEAQRLARWHWQWVVVHDFLPRIVDPAVLGTILEEPAGRPARARLEFYKPKNPNRPMLPVEHAVAAYRFGHSMIRGKYTVGPPGASRTVSIFGPQAGLDNLNAGRPLPRELVMDWKAFYEYPGSPPAQKARLIDTVISAPLYEMPNPPPPDTMRSLAERNLLRGSRVGLASGQEVARAMGIDPLSNAELGMPADRGWRGQAPLWFYVLKEAELLEGGRRLGPVGGRIVAEVLVGLLAYDKDSYLSKKADFRPEPPIAPAPGRFTMPDVLRFAGVAY
ncbi:MAG TPA: heme peroxidase family protein [Acidimicrobiales bacterium]|nr:heme peroxidase family protein [Acidimicrobiales bacterium]